MKKTTVLFVVDEKKMGGVSILLEDILSKLDFDRFDVDVLVLHNHGDRLQNISPRVQLISGTDFFRVVDMPITSVISQKKLSLLLKKVKLVFSLKTGTILKRLKKERKKILRKKYDVEIAFKSGFCTIFTAAGNSKKKISWVHEDYRTNDATEKYHKLFQKIFSSMDVIVGITPTVVRSFQKKYPNCKKYITIPNLVSQDKILKMSKVTEKLQKDKLTLISVGRLHEIKGYDRLIRACGKLKEEGFWKDCTLSLIGSGSQQEQLQQLIQDNHLEESVFLLGQKENPYAYMKQADLFVLSSKSEGFGNVMIESLILKVPVLATEVANIFDTLDDEKYGIIVENSEEGIYCGLKKILMQPELLEEKKQNVKDYHYDNKKIVKQIEQLLEEAR